MPKFPHAELVEAGQNARDLMMWAKDLLETTNARARVVPFNAEVREALYADIRRDRALYIQAVRDHDAICRGMAEFPAFWEGYNGARQEGAA